MSPAPAASYERGAQTTTEASEQYQIELALAPEAHALSATVAVRFTSTGLTEHTDLYLHRALTRGLKIDSTTPTSLRRVSVEADPSHPYHYLERAARIRLFFDPPLCGGTEVELNLEYSGEIDPGETTSPNVIDAAWTEIGLYLPWFPYHPDHGPFTYRLRVTAPPSYEVTDGSPVRGRQGRDGWLIASPEPTQDIVVIAAPELRTQRTKGTGFDVLAHTVAFAEERVEAVSRELATIAEKLQAWLGGKLPPQIVLIVSPRKGGGSYARHNLVVLEGSTVEGYPTNYSAFVHRLAHEVAHLWWYGAAAHTWEDWLNESFAEYSALLAMRDLVGRAAFAQQIALKRAMSAGAPPLWGFARGRVKTERARRQAERLLYHKGPLLIHELVGQIGQDGFLEVCRRMISGEERTTRKLLQAVTAVTGGAARHWLEAALRR
jgi:hypothetical protein